MDNEMNMMLELTWNALKDSCGKFKERYSGIEFIDSNRENFYSLFKENYRQIKERFMKDTDKLDSHKQAAIITISFLKSDSIKCEVREGKICIVPQLVALDVAISYMRDSLNKLLKEKNLKEIGDYILPIPIACETPYLEVIARILYYEQSERDAQYCIMDLADRYFLIEYMNFTYYGINPLDLKQ